VPNPQRLAADLDDAWEVLAEAVQTVLRAEGVPDGYELLKEHSRGKPLTRELLAELIRALPLPEPRRKALLELTPANYVGLAAELAALPSA
jgi:adenylosuccinate lyase